MEKILPMFIGLLLTAHLLKAQVTQEKWNKSDLATILEGSEDNSEFNEFHIPEDVKLKRDYYLKYDDFIGIGSGDGPEKNGEGGLAWEDNGGLKFIGTETVILQTRTKVLYQTVLTTVELTPTVVTIRVSGGGGGEWPRSPSVKNPWDEIPLKTRTPPPFDNSDKKTTNLPDYEEQIGEATDPLFWIRTIIKANKSEVQKKKKSLEVDLARVYATAFKRQLLYSLGLYNESSAEEFLKRKRSTFNESILQEIPHLKWWIMGQRNKVLSRRESPLAIASMNVSVSILNFTSQFNSNTNPKNVLMNYIVCAEGRPIPGSSAVSDLRLVSLKEMEKEIGYQIITKAEPLISQNKEIHSEKMSSSIWFAVAIVTLSVLGLLVIAILFMVWKWKHNRTRDTIDVIGSRLHMGQSGNLAHPSYIGSSPARSSDSLLKRPAYGGKEKKRQKGKDNRGMAEENLASQLNTIISGGDNYRENEIDGERNPGKMESGLLRSEKGRIGSSHIPIRKKPSSKLQPQIEVQKRRIQNIEEDSCGSGDGSNLKTRPEAISYGHLDICKESLARTPSDEAKKFYSSTNKGSSGASNSSQLSDLNYSNKESNNKGGKRKGSFELPYTIKELSDREEEDKDDEEGRREEERPCSSPASFQMEDNEGKRKTTKSFSEESLVSEVLEVVHYESSSAGEGNPLRKMRHRFHQFLDEAFNVIGKKGEIENGRSKSAKISISHEIESREEASNRPWTSEMSKEETITKFRPKSAVFEKGIPPRKAWSERRCQSASSSNRGSGRGSTFEKGEGGGTGEYEDEEVSEADEESSRILFKDQIQGPPSNSAPSFPITFPNYPLYPDIPFDDNNTSPGSNGGRDRGGASTSPSLPLIQAIKNEIKKFEKPNND